VNEQIGLLIFKGLDLELVDKCSTARLRAECGLIKKTDSATFTTCLSRKCHEPLKHKGLDQLGTPPSAL
jgi:hypothetical protein